jgi:hypothetical protein
MDDEIRAEILSKIDKKYDGSKILEQFEETLKYSHLLTVFRLESSDQAKDVDVAILQALLKAKKDKSAQLKLALTWDRIDIAKSYIFAEDKTWEVQ